MILKKKEEELQSDASQKCEIIKAEEDFVQYIRKGMPMYVSQTLRQEYHIIDGKVIKRK